MTVHMYTRIKWLKNSLFHFIYMYKAALTLLPTFTLLAVAAKQSHSDKQEPKVEKKCVQRSISADVCMASTAPISLTVAAPSHVDSSSGLLGAGPRPVSCLRQGQLGPHLALKAEFQERHLLLALMVPFPLLLSHCTYGGWVPDLQTMKRKGMRPGMEPHQSPAQRSLVCHRAFPGPHDIEEVEDEALHPPQLEAAVMWWPVAHAVGLPLTSLVLQHPPVLEKQ
mmetsp:Transcript_8915/g.24281  ORF Transcript_8915/g.24281 Transcript_8915/m.24281 type:complete len:224 (-) Transcript_8915:211-882(-)